MNIFIFASIPLSFLFLFTSCVDVSNKCTFDHDGALETTKLKLLSQDIVPRGYYITQLITGFGCTPNFDVVNYELSTELYNSPAGLEGKAKGDTGKVGIIGGSIEYTGAPYFSAITALKVGSDLVYVITTESASFVIKTYSPDLIVYPFLNPKYLFKIKSLIQKMDIIVIGPGLGREHETLQLIYDIIEHCKTLRKPLVLDADGLYAVSTNVSVIKDYPRPGVILTPNKREAKKLQEAISGNEGDWNKYWGEYVSVLVKGEEDCFYSNISLYNWDSKEGGSGRRAGGQGDILSGALGTFYNWALKSNLCESEHVQLAQSVASYAAAKFTRLCNSKAYAIHGRSMTASDMLSEIHSAFGETFV